ncbi:MULTISPECIES: 2-hydroxyacid dehydrogenase [unclassified Arthrobacter]|uniref:2-hydroxyacid dehydrogenase n=1 Tax=unclassified Arthrobacter TaxID=235627 RepID=UPI001E58AF1B|nr:MULTISPECIES: 2-hydroxyacid dehydrogenase [unclassified Arthrobacter]MCC9146616.1 2-hydroxyacid dehydrogenase [Arthrobacter sp. zg-Y919]MDK1277846.1 2-hydroxyacid dehydrogenase [Arthrobacter sp. zg.Y919]WIB02203.1 2-hydroxyacid dehydrogenase [Arthrobacter sp. zg-Y919]
MSDSTPRSVPVRTLTVPTPELLDALQPLPEGMRAAVWDLIHEPEGLEYPEIDAVVLPYANGSDYGEALQRVPHLLLLQAQSTGYDGLPELVGEQTAIASAAGVHAAATAEMALTLILTAQRGIDDALAAQHEGRWEAVRYPGLADRRVLLVGAGGIGREIAARLNPFDVELTRVGRTARTDDDGAVHGTDELVDLAARAEILVVITPLDGQTRHLIDARVLAALPDGALVVNVARGAVVDSGALTKEVVSGRLRAALDVFDPEPLPADHPLRQAPGAIITPHWGGNTAAFEPRIKALLRKQVRRLAEGQEPLNLVRPGPWG